MRSDVEQLITAVALVIGALGIISVATGSLSFRPTVAAFVTIGAGYVATRVVLAHVRARRHRDEQVQRGLGLIHGYGRKT